MPTFSEITEGWVFCGYRILEYKWERGRVLAKTDYEHMTLERIAEKMRSEMGKEFRRRLEDHGRHPPTMEEVDKMVLQTNMELYAGPLLMNRFQVMKSFLGDSYYIADHLRADYLLRVEGPGSDTKRFPSIADAEAFIKKTFTNHTEQAIDTPSTQIIGSKPEVGATAMPRPVTRKNAEAIKAATEADAKIDRPKKGAKATAAPATPPAPAKAAAPKKGAKITAAAPVMVSEARRGRSATTEGTLASFIRDLILGGKTPDAVIIERAKAAYPEKNVPKNAVDYYRNYLIKNNVDVPAIVSETAPKKGR